MCPIFLALIGCAVCSIDILEKNKIIPFYINEITKDKQIINYYPSNQSNTYVQQILYDYTSESISNIEFNKVDIISSYSETILTIDFMNEVFDIEKNYEKKNYANYIFNLIDKYNQKYQVTCLVDLIKIQSAPIYLNYIAKNIIRFASNNKNLEIELINEPLPYTYEEKKKFKRKK